VRIGPRPILGVRVDVEVGFEVVCNLMLVTHCLGFGVVKCINMFGVLSSFDVTFGMRFQAI